MENKYYTPEIEEFHIGFEYEIYSDKIATYPINGSYEQTNFHRHKYDTKDIRLSQLGTRIFEKKVRVKYLDKEDIESLGFDKLSKDKYFLEYGILIPGADYYWHPYGNWKYRITTPDKDFPNSFIIEGRNPSNAGTFRKFVGTIKNKSELKKLMKQLGIYEL